MMTESDFPIKGAARDGRLQRDCCPRGEQALDLLDDSIDLLLLDVRCRRKMVSTH